MKRTLKYFLVLFFGLILFQISHSHAFAECSANYDPQNPKISETLTISITQLTKGDKYRIAFGPKGAQNDQWIFNKEFTAKDGEDINASIQLGDNLQPGDYDLEAYHINGSNTGCFEGQQRNPVSIRSADSPDDPADAISYATNPSDLNTIDGNTKSVSITFQGLTESKYYLCLASNQDKCKKKDDFVIYDPSKPLTVCGDGPEGLKADGIDGRKCQTNDYFHEGNGYVAGLFSFTNPPAPLTAIRFTIRHVFPDVYVKSKNGNYILLIHHSTQDSPGTGARLDEIREGAVEETNTTPITAANSLNIQLKQIPKAGGSNRNNFRIHAKSSAGDYEFENCYTIRSSSPSSVGNSGTITINQDGHALLPGGYYMEIMERVNEGTFHSDDCQGGFVYYRIPFDAKGDTITFHPEDIEVDPLEQEISNKANDKRLGPLPCIEGLAEDGTTITITDKNPQDVENIVTCTKYSTAIGSFAINDPFKLAETLAQWLLSISTIAAFGFMIYAGYLLMTSRGDKEKVAKAREILTSAITGFVFLVLSVAILEIIGVNILQIPQFSSSPQSASQTTSPGTKN